jgi:hypothetical protein
MATSGSSRARRFSLPDLADERTSKAIDAFLIAPERSRGRGPAPHVGRPGGTPFASLETRMAWLEALHRESARNLRYRRPAAVMVIAAEPAPGGRAAQGWLTRVAGPIAHAVHRSLRETDLMTRVGDARFQVLLPETTAREAKRVADRVVADCDVWLQAMDAPIILRASAAGTGSDVTLEAALDRALAAISV